MRIQEVGVAHRRTVLLMQAMGAFQLACGGFALATLLALLGAALGLLGNRGVNIASLAIVLSCKGVAVASIMRGSFLVVVESRMAYVVLRQVAEYTVALFQPPEQG